MGVAMSQREAKKRDPLLTIALDEHRQIERICELYLREHVSCAPTPELAVQFRE